MTITVGDSLPEAAFLVMTDDGPKEVSLSGLSARGPLVLFGLPGAYTPTCHSAHLPSFIRTRDRLAEAGVATVACVSVNDPFLMRHWGESTGALAAGIEMLADPEARFVTEIGLVFSAPTVGFINRSQRFSLLAEGGVVRQLNVEEPGAGCVISAGETLLDRLRKAA